MNAASQDAESAALRTLLRSFGQIVLQPNAFTGLCLFSAWLVCDPRLACAASIGAIAANIGAVLAAYREDETRDGLHGFNGALAGLAAYSFVADDATAAALAILAGISTAWLLRPWSRWLRGHGLGVYSSPCLIVTWLWLPLVKGAPAAPPAAHAALFAQGLSGWTSGALAGWAGGVFSGLAQTGFASGAVPGLLMLVGIAASSRRHAFWALTGSAIAGSVHLMLGESATSYCSGLAGFNGALTAIALADGAPGAALGGILLSVALQQFADHLGLPGMTAPFVAATWSMQWIRRKRGWRASVDNATHADEVAPHQNTAGTTNRATAAASRTG